MSYQCASLHTAQIYHIESKWLNEKEHQVMTKHLEIIYRHCIPISVAALHKGIAARFQPDDAFHVDKRLLNDKHRPDYENASRTI